MKSLILEGKRILTLCEVEEPEESENNQIILVEAVGIGGSEYLGFNNPGIRPLPSIMGHGIAGTTSDGKRVAVYPLSGCMNCEYCKNDQVQLCDEWSLIGVQTGGGFSQKISVPENSLFEMPENMSWEQSVFIEPFANSVNAWEISKASHTDSIAIIGAGSLGLGIVALANKCGCQIIHIAEFSRSRRYTAAALGANETLSKLTETYDIVFDTIGSEEARTQAIASTKKGGKIIFLGFEVPELNINMSEIIRHQKQLIGSFVYSKGQFIEAMNIAANCDSQWVTNISFAETENHLVRFLQGDFEQIKIALRPQNI